VRRARLTIEEKGVRVEHELVVGSSNHASDLTSSLHLPQLQESVKRSEQISQANRRGEKAEPRTPCSA
jgi:hypothetical protein